MCAIPLSAITKSHSITHHSFGNDLQLQAPAPPDEISELLYSMQSSKSNVSYWATAIMLMRYDYNALHASVVHASGSGQLQANPHVAGPWLSPGKPTRRAVTTMGSNDLVVGDVHMLGPSCQRYNWHTGRCGSIALGSSPRRGKALISNPRCLAEVSTRGKDFRR